MARPAPTGRCKRGNVRLVYDLPQRALRFTAGDLSYPVFGYQTMVNMAGSASPRTSPSNRTCPPIE